MLAPATACAIAALLVEGALPAQFHPFRPERFGGVHA
jgi:hypothetical protein